MSKYEIIFGPYFPVFVAEITPYLDTFHVVLLVKISQFEFLVMTEKITTPLKKVTPSFPATPPLKLRSCQASLPPLFENMVGASTPTPPPPPTTTPPPPTITTTTSRKGAGCTLWLKKILRAWRISTCSENSPSKHSQLLYS